MLLKRRLQPCNNVQISTNYYLFAKTFNIYNFFKSILYNIRDRIEIYQEYHSKHVHSLIHETLPTYISNKLSTCIALCRM